MLVEGNGWTKPADDTFRLNVDAAVVRDSSVFGLGIVVRDDCGMPVFAAAIAERGLVSVEAAEAKAILEGLRVAVQRDFLPIAIESDALNVVRLCRFEDFIRSDLGNFIQDIQDLLSACASSSISFIPRHLNSMAHALASKALSLNCALFWDSWFPDWLLDLASVDVFSSCF
ncbi:hypothetical protein ACOSQ2_012542 [Xanthoceras sorbifolium]